MASEEALANALAHTSGGRSAAFREGGQLQAGASHIQMQLRQGSEAGRRGRGNVPWVGSKDQLAGGLWTSLILAETQPRGHSLAVSNYDKWHG